MARLTVEGLTKSFGSFRALDDVSLQVNDGEFVAILGPSGCGKTTLLRQIAGFDKSEAGRILIGNSVVSSAATHVPPERRRIGIVFQSYALWPHMSVAENVAYGLTVAGVKEPERSRRVDAALSLVDLDGFGQRTPAMLSGGQRQRVALARCLVTEPGLVLLDEPLANLDVHLRASMEDEFVRFHERTGTTMIYITHDQAEAMALADRIGVMDSGRLLQLAKPSQLYREPANARVAGFVGDGMVLPVAIRSVDGDGTCAADLYGHVVRVRCEPTQKAVSAAQVCLRARDLTIVAPDAAGVAARVDRAVYQGGFFRLEAHVEAAPDKLLHLTVPEPFMLAPGAAVKLDVADGWIISGTGRN
ncbi:MAG: ABC transporter ATP-binding protein [Betaproteobacteria bacterium]|nr:MAG: ABC transporter ATP-binding protein [Betaproteobacteria bacterium]